MKVKNAFLKHFLVFAVCLALVLQFVPMVAFADGTFTFASGSQSGDNNSTLRYYLTDENAADVTINEETGRVQFYLDMDEGWYFEKWDTYFNGYKDRPILTDPEVTGNNPVNDDGFYTFYNINGSNQPFVNDSGTGARRFIYIAKGTNFYGDHRITAVLKPIVTVNADAGVSYLLTTDNPTVVSANQTAVKYKDDVTVAYTAGNEYVITNVGANGTKDIAIDEANGVITLSCTEKPTNVDIRARRKQQHVNFDACGGVGQMALQTFKSGVEGELSANVFTKAGHIFKGWNTKADGSGIAYADSEKVTFTPTNDGDSITLYAQWKENRVAGSGTVSLIGWTYGETPNSPTVTSETNGTGGVTYFYKEKGAADATYTSVVPTQAGKYTLKAVFAQTDLASEATATVDFEIAKATYDMSAAKWNYTKAFLYNGNQHTIEVTGLPSGVTVSGYTNNSATNVGKYTAKVNFNYDSNNYNTPVIDDIVWEIKKDWSNTENTEKVKDITDKNVTPEDKNDLTNAKADLEKALNENGDFYTEQEKEAIENELKRIDDALAVIENLDKLNPPKTSDNSKLLLWFALLLISGAGILTTALKAKTAKR